VDRVKKRKTKEPQNQMQIDAYQDRGPVQLGPWTSYIWRSDPRHLAFVLARYKFCAKILAGKSEVLEIGCGDAFGMILLLQTVESVHGIDWEPIVIEDTRSRLAAENIERCSLSVLNITEKPMDRKFDAAYSLDVIEHIPPESEERFLTNICSSLRPDAICIIGTPNVEAQKDTTAISAQGHVNLQSAESLRKLLSSHFHNVFIFSMNDEVVHTGLHSMAHYLLGVGAGLKESG